MPALSTGDLYVILDQMEENFLYHGVEGGHRPSNCPGSSGRPRRTSTCCLRFGRTLCRDSTRFPAGACPASSGIACSSSISTGRPRARRIVEPLERWNALGDGDHVGSSPRLVDAVLAQVAASRGDVGGNGGARLAAADRGRIEAPYLQLVMERLWSEERSGGIDHAQEGDARSSRRGCSHRRVSLRTRDRRASPESRELAASAFAHLVTASGMKIAHTTDDLAAYAHSSEGAMLGVLESLTRQRILRAEQGEGAGQTRFEVFHDVLAAPVLSWRRSFEEERRLEAERVAAAKTATGGCSRSAVVSLVGARASRWDSLSSPSPSEARPGHRPSRRASTPRRPRRTRPEPPPPRSGPKSRLRRPRSRRESRMPASLRPTRCRRSRPIRSLDCSSESRRPAGSNTPESEEVFARSPARVTRTARPAHRRVRSTRPSTALTDPGSQSRARTGGRGSSRPTLGGCLLPWFTRGSSSTRGSRPTGSWSPPRVPTGQHDAGEVGAATACGYSTTGAGSPRSSSAPTAASWSAVAARPHVCGTSVPASFCGRWIIRPRSRWLQSRR